MYRYLKLTMFIINEEFKNIYPGFLMERDIAENFFKNQDSHKAYLRNCFNAFSELTYYDVLNYCKMVEISQTKSFDKFYF